MMDANKEIVLRLAEELLNEGRAEVIDELIHPDCETRDPAVGSGAPAVGQDPLREAHARLLQAFGELRVRLEVIVSEGEHVAARWRLRGRHTGVLGNLAPTYRAVEVSGLTLCLIAQGRVRRIDQHWDRLALLRALEAERAGGQ